MTQVYSVQIWCIKVQTRVKSKAKMLNTAFNLHAILHGLVNLMTNAVFTVFALYLTVVSTFYHQICTEQICCKSIFRAVKLNLPCIVFTFALSL